MSFASTTENPYTGIVQSNALRFLEYDLDGRKPILLLMPDRRILQVRNKPNYRGNNRDSLILFFTRGSFGGKSEVADVGLIMEIFINHILERNLVLNPDIKIIYAPYEADRSTETSKGCDYILCKLDESGYYIPLVGIDVTLMSQNYTTLSEKKKTPGVNEIYNVPVIILPVTQEVFFCGRSYSIWIYIRDMLRLQVAYGLYDYTRPLKFMSQESKDKFIVYLRRELSIAIRAAEEVFLRDYPVSDFNFNKLRQLIEEEL